MAITFYKDLPLDFTAHPVTGDVRPVTDDVAIKRSIRNLILTPKGKKLFNPNYGSFVQNYLFKPQDQITKFELEQSLYNCIKIYENRVDITRIEANFNDVGIEILVEYRTKNTGSVSSFVTTVKRTA